MKSVRGKRVSKSWYIWLIAALYALQAAVFLIYRDNSYLQIHDNLDLFMAHFEMMKRSGAFFSQGTDLPMLHGVPRDLFGSEFSLYNILYLLLPGVWAYLAGYALKIVIGFCSFLLLAKDLCGNSYDARKPVVMLCAAAFSLIPVFPTYGIAFTSVPLLIWLLRKLYGMTSGRTGTRASVVGILLIYLLIFLYPLLSYFSYHGFFILCYITAAVLILWVRDRRFPLGIFISAAVLSAGYMTFEYRLFREMLFGDTVTIRTTMEHGELTFSQALGTAFTEFVKASFHSEDSHTYLVLPVVLAGFVVINAGYITGKKLSGRTSSDHGKSGKALYGITHEPLNGILLIIIFNCLIFGFYQYAPFRRLVETLVPKLTGFEFARFAYFNTLLWYAALAIVCIRMYESGKKLLQTFGMIIPAAALIIVMFAPAMYNDFYYTCYNQAYRLLLHRETSTVNYREFYSEELFDEVKKDIGYDGEWSAAYGIHPAVLEYNGIATVDGYLGMYSQAYKDTWEKVIAPAFPGSHSLEAYFRDWGARVNLISPADENTYAPLRVLKLSDERLVADMDELKKLDCVYIFSRIRFSNEEEAGLTLKGAWETASSPYVIYVYVIR